MHHPYLLNKAKDLWGKKWRQPILFILKNGPKRFSEIKALLPECSTKILTQTLRDMEKKHLIVRKQYNTIPVKVTYEIHDDLVPLTDLFERYRVLLIEYFRNTKDIHGLPSFVIDFINRQPVTVK